MPEASAAARVGSPGSLPYGSAGRLQAAGLRRATAVFSRLAESVPLPGAPRPIMIADYGAATGRNALRPVTAAIGSIRQRTSADHSVLVVHTDLPGNDFTQLFTTLSDDPDSYLSRDAASFPSAIGRSFYDQILPSGTVTLGWSCWAMMWLSRPASELPQFTDHVHVLHSRDAAARTAYANQAAADWRAFLTFRDRELAPGGKLVVLTAAIADDGESGHRPVLDAIIAGLDEQARDGLLSAAEVQRMTIPVAARSACDLRAPFGQTGRFERLSIEQLEVFDADDRFWNRYLVDGDAGAFGSHWAAFIRAALLSTLIAALDGGRNDPRAAEFAQRLEVAVAARLAGAPERVRIPLALVVLAKRPR